MTEGMAAARAREKDSWEEWWTGTRRLRSTANPQTTSKLGKRKNIDSKEVIESDSGKKKLKKMAEGKKEPSNILRKKKEVRKGNK